MKGKIKRVRPRYLDSVYLFLSHCTPAVGIGDGIGDIDGVRVGVGPNLGEGETVERGVVLGSETTVDTVGLKRELKIIGARSMRDQDSSYSHLSK